MYITYDDDGALSGDKLDKASLNLKIVVTFRDGQVKTLSEIIVPPKGEYQALVKSGYQHFDNEFDRWMEEEAQDTQYEEFRTTGIYRFRVNYTWAI